MNTQIAVVTHRKYPIFRDELYLPLMAGAFDMSEAETAGYVRDDSGDSISDRNPEYCELTGLYWMWKNFDAQNAGICHYRRYFASPGRGKKRVLRQGGADQLMARYSVVLPRPRRYIIESNYSQFAHSHGSYALDEVRKIIADRYPEYIEAYDRRMAMTTGHRFNMFIMRRDLLDRYCTWLFDILFELEKRVNDSSHADCSARNAERPIQINSQRLYGYVAERLLDVWLDREGLDYCEVPYIFTGRENLMRKAAAMVMRKLRASVWKSR